jgi:hypothetical protein
VFGPDLALVEGADDFQAPQHAQHAVVFAPRGLGVEMAADIDRRQARFGSLAAGKHGAHLVDGHGQALGGAPLREQAAALGVLVGQGLAVVAARHAGADPGHLHQAVPKPVAVDRQIRTRSRHDCLPCLVALTVW